MTSRSEYCELSTVLELAFALMLVCGSLAIGAFAAWLAVNAWKELRDL